MSISIGDGKYKGYIKILSEELVPAMGCTEPIAIAYCAAVARKTLGCMPNDILVEASGNIIKNVKSVVVPNTGGLRGIEAAAIAGIVAGDADKKLEVISLVSDDQKREMQEMLVLNTVKVGLTESELVFDLVVTVRREDSYAKVRIVNHHTNIILVEKNKEVLFAQELLPDDTYNLTDRSILNVKDILEFANIVDVNEIRDIVGRQVEYNMAIAREGLANDYGANVGSLLIKDNWSDVQIKAKAMAAAGSDARMSGCALPVVINSGSGNQGITASVPVIVYANELGVGEDKLYRALLVSNLIAIHQKTGIGRLSAFCGAINAGAAAACGIAYLLDGSYEAITHTLVNALAVTSGVICDGAKPSCAGKIAIAIDSGLFGYTMYKNNQQFLSGNGILKNNVETTIQSVAQLARDGMRETDREILRIMIAPNP